MAPAWANALLHKKPRPYNDALHPLEFLSTCKHLSVQASHQDAWMKVWQARWHLAIFLIDTPRSVL
ncbi:hypothetical protein HZ99_19575 [Pseudomonas fluorescens]|nr:hypothetical protein HZ99_19575 [Pseudomonas fluorescens]